MKSFKFFFLIKCVNKSMSTRLKSITNFNTHIHFKSCPIIKTFMLCFFIHKNKRIIIFVKSVARNCNMMFCC